MSEENIINSQDKSESEDKKEEETKEKKVKSKTSKSKKSKGEEKELYFIIFYKRKQKEKPEEFIFSEDCASIPQTIFSKEEITTTNNYAYKKVFKYKNKGGKKNVELIFFFREEDDKYIITLEPNDKIFIYDLDLKKGHKFLDSIPIEIINQKVIGYQEKFDLFLEALEQNNEENKNERLYEETIDIISKKGNFSLLISLFTKIYQEKKLCESLLKKFYYMNIKISRDKKGDNPCFDRDKKLGEQFNSLMVKIATNSESLMYANGYNPIHFYGLLFCYLNCYDYETFENCVNELNCKQPSILYEILLIYYLQFFKPVKKEQSGTEFFFKFFSYIMERKEFSDFTTGLRCISDINTFIKVIDENKEKIFYNYIRNEKNGTSFKPIELDGSLQLQKEKINMIIRGIESINEYSKGINCLLVYFKSDFWKSLLRDFNKAEPECFLIVLKLRNYFIEYSHLIDYICDRKKDKAIIKDISDFHKIDEFAYILNENIKQFLKEKQGKLNNSEILGYIKRYNPYYNEPEYKYKRELDILDYLDFHYDIYSTDEDVIREHFNFIETFRELDYLDIFKDNMEKFIDAMVNKITDISSFDTVMDLISVGEIKEKIKGYLEKLKNKYELVVKTEIEKLSGDKVKKAQKIIAKFEKLIFDKKII